ncbi:MAG: hypothetical protein UU89_C0038G0005 [Parcubacteria group bacterium GW2011_GWC2_42_11]|nr:MAG: hypothetical protein UU89_C0038G0005 [Parcubacteria group bacterium GW2011_GWC2_42_11]
MEEAVKYTPKFVEKVKAVYPERTEVHEAVERGSELVGRYLELSRNLSMSPAQIIEAFEQGREQDVLTAAKKADECAKLYAEWNKFYTAQW